MQISSFLMVEWTDGMQAICSLLGVLVTVIGFIYVIKQLNSAKKANQIATYENLYARMHDIHKFFFEHPGYRDYFYHSKRIDPGHDDYQKVMTVAEMFADFLQQVKLQSDLMPKKTANGWINYAHSVLRRSPVLREFLVRNKDWYPSNFFQDECNRQVIEVEENKGSPEAHGTVAK